MTTTIILLGPVSHQDAGLLRHIGKESGCDMAAKSGIADLPALGPEQAVAGIISFLPFNADSMNLLGQRQSSAEGAPLPLFQLVGGTDVPAMARESRLMGVFVSPLVPLAAWSMVRTILKCHAVNIRNHEMIGELLKAQKQKSLLVEAGTALSRENDLDRLLDVILTISRNIAGADAGSIYVRERSGPGGGFLDLLRFKITQNDSVNIGRKAVEFQIPIDHNSISGYVAAIGTTLRIDDMAALDASLPYRPGKDVQKKLGYPVKSMLTLPLRNKDGEVVGVLQLMNKKKQGGAKITSAESCAAGVAPFSLADVEFIESIASQAAVSIERAQLYESIQALFDGFLESSSAAIDARDHVTSGHSKRVMGYAMAFLDAAGGVPAGPFAELAASPDRRRQFQVAALLHDIGKIGVPEQVLTKEGRLHAAPFATLMARLDLVEFALQHAPATVAWRSAAEAADDRAFLKRINTAGRLSDDDLRRLEGLRAKYFHSADGSKIDFMSEAELHSLSVRAGNLTAEERELINSHASSTFRILSKIPWTRQLEMIPTIAAMHHEKMDGSGYPYGVKAEDICLESRVLAVVDIYEALVAQDRPYKPKMEPEKALEILDKEVAAGHLDATVVAFFKDKGIYRLFTDQKKT